MHGNPKSAYPAGRGDLARALADYVVHPTDFEGWGLMADEILADPEMLLRALAEAGVLTLMEYEAHCAARYEDLLTLGGKSPEEVREIHHEAAKRAPIISVNDVAGIWAGDDAYPQSVAQWIKENRGD